MKFNEIKTKKTFIQYLKWFIKQSGLNFETVSEVVDLEKKSRDLKAFINEYGWVVEPSMKSFDSLVGHKNYIALKRRMAAMLKLDGGHEEITNIANLKSTKKEMRDIIMEYLEKH